MTIERRVGARQPHKVPEHVKQLLLTGEPSVNHMEQIALDMGTLLAQAFPHLADQADQLRRGGLVTRMRDGGRVLHEAYGSRAPTVAAAHRSDTVRGWGAMAVAAQPSTTIDAALARLRRFADDEHFAVREWAWLALRPAVVADCAGAIAALELWTGDPSANIRRFASEATRPRGVWSVHLPELKQHPETAQELLGALRSDPSRYVQDSVANWLNDASRTRPDWTQAICTTWLQDSPTTATERICHRACRTLRRIG